MVRKILFLGLILACHSSYGVDLSKCSKQTDEKPPLCVFKLPKIDKIVIEANGAEKPGRQTEPWDCSAIRMTQSDVHKYLRLAKSVPNEFYHDTDWSRCHTFGKVFFKDGRQGEWDINLLGYGQFSFMESENWQIIHCEKCLDIVLRKNGLKDEHEIYR